MTAAFGFTPGLLTKDAAAFYLSTSIREIDELRATGALVPVGNSKRVTFTVEELDRYRLSLPERDST